MPTPYVIDIYRLDPVNSFQAIKDAGIKAVIHKASEGSTHVDRLYANRRQVFVDLGLQWGAYHFFHGDGKQEADHFLQAAEPDEHTVLALDWETTAGGYTPNATRARAFLERIEERLGRKAVVYSGNVAKEQLKGKDDYFGSHRLWLAQYAPHWKVQDSWEQPWLWQYGSEITRSKVPGIGGYCDVNTVVDGTIDDFIATWVDTPKPTPAPPAAFTQEGIASWYDDNTNASGKPVNNATDMTCAHKTLPFGTNLEVRRKDTNTAVIVTVQDRGPYESGRIIDLRPAAAKALDITDIGIVPVQIRQVVL